MNTFPPETPAELLMFQQEMEKLLPNITTLPISGTIQIAPTAEISIHSHSDYPAVAFCCLLNQENTIHTHFYIAVEGMSSDSFIQTLYEIYIKEEAKLAQGARNEGKHFH